jgi:hypothetical protein
MWYTPYYGLQPKKASVHSGLWNRERAKSRRSPRRRWEPTAAAGARLGARAGARGGSDPVRTTRGPPWPVSRAPAARAPPAGSPGLAPLRGPAAAARRAPGGRGQAVRAGVRAMRGQEIPDRRPRPSAVRHPPRARALHRSRVGQDRAPCACAEIGEHLQNLTDNTCISERRIMTQTMAHLLLLVVSSYSAGLVRYRRFGRPCHVLTLCCTFRRV